MKPVEQTHFFRWVTPLIFKMLPIHPARRFWCLFIVSALLVQVVNIGCSFWNGFLGDPAEYTAGYYGVLLVETVRYGGWLWGFWYGFYQIARLSPKSRLITPQLLSCTVTGGLLLFLLNMVAGLVDAGSLLLVQGMLILGFAFGVLLPTLWQPASGDR